MCTDWEGSTAAAECYASICPKLSRTTSVCVVGDRRTRKVVKWLLFLPNRPPELKIDCAAAKMSSLEVFAEQFLSRWHLLFPYTLTTSSWPIPACMHTRLPYFLLATVKWWWRDRRTPARTPSAWPRPARCTSRPRSGGASGASRSAGGWATTASPCSGAGSA